jgi:2-polyprenyl-3-methyl-5-hydroxy-6-metoxy-1,4-benzoquinol methylase
MNSSPSICPICDSPSNTQFIESDYVYGGRDDQSIVHCDNCDLYYLTPAPTQNELNFFYENSFEDFMSKRSGSDANWSDSEQHVSISKREYVRRKKFIDEYLYPGCKVIDIGASTGFMLTNILKDNPYVNVTAVEPSTEFTDYLNSINIENYKYIDDIDNETKFDLVLHFFVIAHVEDVKNFMIQCYSKIAKGGVMVFETPSASDPLYALYDIKEYRAFFWQVAHIYTFTEKSMSFFLKSMGWSFKVTPHQRYDISNHMSWMQTGKPGGRGKYSQIFSHKLEEEYKINLQKSGYYDSLIVTIYKT